MRAHSILRLSACLLLLLSFPFAAGAQEANQGFLTVRQILEDNCSACHDWTASFQGIADPSRVTPGSPEKSRLYTMVASDEMPMGGEPLPVTQKNLLRAWIAAGATESEEPLSLALPEAAQPEAAAAPSSTVPAPPVRRFNKLKFHQVSGFTSASLFLAAGAIGVVQFGTLISASHAYRDANGIDEDEISSQCAGYIIDLWNDPEHLALRWTHVGLLTAGEGFYLYNTVTGIGMLSKERPGLSRPGPAPLRLLHPRQPDAGPDHPGGFHHGGAVPRRPLVDHRAGCGPHRDRDHHPPGDDRFGGGRPAHAEDVKRRENHRRRRRCAGT